MYSLTNSVTLIGNLGNDVELTTFDSGAIKARASIATHSVYKDKNGERIEKTQWHPIVAWNKTAELMGKILKKGSRVIVQGELVHENYKNKEGEVKYVSNVKVREFKNFTSKEENLPF